MRSSNDWGNLIVFFALALIVPLAAFFTVGVVLTVLRLAYIAMTGGRTS